MKTIPAIATVLSAIILAAPALSAEKKKEVSPLILAALNSLTTEQHNQYQAARSRVPNDDGLAVKTWFAQTSRLNPTVRFVLELDFADALLDTVRKTVDIRKKPAVIRRARNIDLSECKRRVKDAESILLLLKGRVQNMTLLWPEIETRLTEIESLKKQLGE